MLYIYRFQSSTLLTMVTFSKAREFTDSPYIVLDDDISPYSCTIIYIYINMEGYILKTVGVNGCVNIYNFSIEKMKYIDDDGKEFPRVTVMSTFEEKIPLVESGMMKGILKFQNIWQRFKNKKIKHTKNILDELNVCSDIIGIITSYL